MRTAVGLPVRGLMDRSPVRVATIGAAFAANKGSASMLHALITNLPAVIGPCRFEVLTTYPRADARERPGPEVAVVPYRPWELVFPLLPLALLVALLRRLRLPRRWLGLHPALRALAGADVVVDVAGISFVDGRPLPLLAYNSLMTGIPLLLGAKVVKGAQALGPFRAPLNRFAARHVLSQLSRVVARGGTSYDHLQELGLENASRAADLAFTLVLPDRTREAADRLLSELGVAGPFVAIVPSAVVEGYCRRDGVDYLGRLAELIERIANGGVDAMVIPHAARPGRPGGRMNDLPLVRELHARAAGPRCHLLDRSLSPEVLRAIIERAVQLVTSRFHAMISALSVGTPVLVVGWSHKYGEVLRDFGLEPWAVDHAELARGGLIERFEALAAASPAIRARIAGRLPAIVADAHGNFAAVAAALTQAEGSP